MSKDDIELTDEEKRQFLTDVVKKIKEEFYLPTSSSDIRQVIDEEMRKVLDR